MSQGYDNQYRVSSIVTGSIVNLTFGYDPNGNIISILDGVNPPGSEPIDNPGTYTYQQGTNKLTHIEGTLPADFGYDLNGNITTENTWTYIYDLSNQLIRVLDNTNQVAEYTYNGAGQRIKKVTQTETRIFHYDLLGHLIAETNQAGQMLAEYVYLGDQLLAMIKPGEAVYYFHNDHLWTPQVLTDDTQTIAWKAVYTPFGEAVPSIQTVENPFRFPGQYYDPETGLHYNYFRYYNPQTGRYITPDPIGLEGGINLFAYVLNDPIDLIDPYGLLTKPVPGPIRPPDKGAPMGSYYGSRRRKQTPTGWEWYPHRGIDLLAPVGATVVAPISGTVKPWGPEGVRICRRNGTICCNGVEIPRMICWKIVHINPTVTKGYIQEGKPIGTVLPQISPVPPHVDVEYYETICENGKARDARQDPTSQFEPMAY